MSDTVIAQLEQERDELRSRLAPLDAELEELTARKEALLTGELASIKARQQQLHEERAPLCAEINARLAAIQALTRGADGQQDIGRG